MRKELLLSGFILICAAASGQVQTSARKTEQTNVIPVTEQKAVQPDSAVVLSSGRFSTPVIVSAPVNEKIIETRETKSSAARKPE